MQAHYSDHDSLSRIAAEAVRQYRLTEDAGGKRATTLKESAPLWLRSAIDELAGHMPADDWLYHMSRRACQLIAEAETDIHINDIADAFVGSADTHISDLLDWLSSHIKRMDYCDRAINESKISKLTMIYIIRRGQGLELGEIFGAIRKAIEDRHTEESEGKIGRR
jgi:hypothetical protein